MIFSYHSLSGCHRRRGRAFNGSHAGPAAFAGIGNTTGGPFDIPHAYLHNTSQFKKLMVINFEIRRSQLRFEDAGDQRFELL
jgi:hypothetical protein